MSNAINGICFDILNRLESANLAKINHETVLRRMRKVYMAANRECKCIQRTYTVDEDNRETDEDYWILPSDFLELFAKEGSLRGSYTFQGAPGFDYDTRYSFTIEGDGATKKLIVPGAPDDFSMTLHYTSLGKLLVDLEDDDDDYDTDTESNVPEWESEDLWDGLIFGTCIKLSNEYNFYKEDYVEFTRIKGILRNTVFNRQSADYESGGGYELLERL